MKAFTIICAVALCILFFLPLVSCNSFTGLEDDGFSGYDIATREDGNPAVFALLAIPAILAFIAVCRGKFKVLSLLSVAGLIAVIIFMIAIKDKYEDALRFTLFLYVKLGIYVTLIIGNLTSINKDKT